MGRRLCGPDSDRRLGSLAHIQLDPGGRPHQNEKPQENSERERNWAEEHQGQKIESDPAYR